VFEVPEARSTKAWKMVLESTTQACQAGDWERAVQLYAAFIEHNPHHAEAYYKRAVAFDALGRLKLALADYDRATSLNPRYAYAFCNRGSVLERLGRKEDAMCSFDTAISINPADFLAHYNRGTVLKQLGHPQEAMPRRMSIAAIFFKRFGIMRMRS
jgi:tetratricopeptide (TPR) repeat protein